MGRKFITPLEDASIYEQFPTRNTGDDEILEVGKTRKVDGSVRSLIQFSQAEIVAMDDAAAAVTQSVTYYLNLRIAKADNLTSNQRMEFYEVTQSWDEGTGFLVQDLENAKDGATWLVADIGDTSWSFSATPSSGSSPGGATGSLTTPNGSVIFGFKPDDIRLDITDTVNRWLGGLPNYGLLLKIPSGSEADSKVISNLKFFSKNTHTIYPPTLEAVWNTQTIDVLPNCGLTLAPEEFELFIPNARASIPTGSTTRIRFGLRTSQPIKNFSDTFQFSNKFYLNSGSHIGIRDAATRAFVVPFDTGSFISADSTGSYFDLKVENMYIGRTYNILVRVEKPWGSEVIDTGHSFRVT